MNSLDAAALWASLVPYIIAIASSTVLAAAVNGFFVRRKTRAEVKSTEAAATKLITEAAAGVVINLNTDNAQLRLDVASLRRRITFLERWKDAAEHNFDLHEGWDGKVARELRALDADLAIGNPPALRPDITEE